HRCTLPGIPQPVPCDDAGRLHEDEREERRALMEIDDVLRHGPDAPQRLLRGIAGHVGRERYQREREEHGERAAFEVLALFQQAEDEKTETDDHADCRKVVEQEMDVNEIRGRQHQATAPRASTAYAMSRPEVITASQSTRHATAVF